MTDMPTGLTPDPADTGPRINGVVDAPRPGRVAGWAIDRADPGAAVTVTVLREGRVVAEVRADAHRPDLERGGIGTGRYGFAVDLDPPLEPGFEFTIAATARAADGTAGELRPVGRAGPDKDPTLRLAQRTFSELTALRVGLGRLAGRQDRDAEARTLEALDRIEVVQARREQIAAGAEPVDGQSTGRGLALAVAVALATGVGSLALGLWSMFAG